MAADLVGAGDVRPNRIADRLIGPGNEDLGQELVVDGGDAGLHALEFRLDHQQQCPPTLALPTFELFTPRGLRSCPAGRGGVNSGLAGSGSGRMNRIRRCAMSNMMVEICAADPSRTRRRWRRTSPACARCPPGTPAWTPWSVRRTCRSSGYSTSGDCLDCENRSVTVCFEWWPGVPANRGWTAVLPGPAFPGEAAAADGSAGRRGLLNGSGHGVDVCGAARP